MNISEDMVRRGYKGEVETDQDRQRWELECLREWLNRHLQTNIISRRTGLGGHDGNGTTWAVVAIPDWEVKQRIERINVALKGENSATNQQEQRRKAVSFVRFATECDQCQGTPPKARSEEYASFPTCRICGDHVCKDHRVFSETTEDDNRTLCHDCAGTLIA